MNRAACVDMKLGDGKMGSRFAASSTVDMGPSSNWAELVGENV